MTDILVKPTGRRAFLGSMAAGGTLLALPACSSIGGFGLVDAVQRILFLSSERAFGRMLQGEGFWDQQVAELGLGGLLGSRGDVLTRILTSALFKNRLERAFGDIAYEGAERAAPLVTEAVRTIGIQNAIDLVRGGPTAATTFLRGSMGRTLVEAMVPELGAAMRVLSDRPDIQQQLRDDRSLSEPNGNSVSLETEMVDAVAAKRQSDRALAIYRSGLTILRASIGRS